MTENEGGASEVNGQRRTETHRATKADRQGQNRPDAALERDPQKGNRTQEVDGQDGSRRRKAE